MKLRGILPGVGRRAPESFDFMLDFADAVFRIRVVAEKLDCAPLALSLNLFEKFDHPLGIVSAIVKDLRSHEVRLALGVTRIFQKQRIEPEPYTQLRQYGTDGITSQHPSQDSERRLRQIRF